MAVLWIIAQLLLWIMYSPLTTLAHVPDSPEKNSAIPHNGNQTTHPDYLPETTHGGINGDITAINGDITPVQNGHIDDDSSDSSLTDQPTHIVSIRQIIVGKSLQSYTFDQVKSTYVALTKQITLTFSNKKASL